MLNVVSAELVKNWAPVATARTRTVPFELPQVIWFPLIVAEPERTE
jgi:hypothetical protein